MSRLGSLISSQGGRSSVAGGRNPITLSSATAAKAWGVGRRIAPKPKTSRTVSCVERGCANTSPKGQAGLTASKCNEENPVAGSRLDRLVRQSASKRGRSSSFDPQQSVKRHCSMSRSTNKPQKNNEKCKVVVLSAVETDEQHKFRHPTFQSSCPRCAFLNHGSHWKRFAAWKVDSKVCTSWLSPRPAHMGGDWALGCQACAALLETRTNVTTKEKPRRGKWQAKLRANKWARFRVTRLLKPSLATAAVSNHHRSKFHRQAVLQLQALDAKTAASPKLCSAASESSTPELVASSTHQAGLTAVASFTIEEGTAEQAKASTLLKGRVPQLQDWIDAWASASSTTSYLKESRIRQKKSEARVSLGIRKRLRKQVRVMADVLRDKHRQALTAATSISIAVDSRGKYKVARFRCDSHQHPYYIDGILGTFHCGYKSLEDAEVDHGERMQRNLQRCIARFWTPLGGARLVDQEKEMLKKVRCLASDGGASERKLMFRLARGLCPRVVLVIRDFAHAARIAIQRPQQFDPVFDAVHTHLFNNGSSAKKHAVIPDIQYSDKLKDLLVSAQQVYLRIPCERHPLRVVLRHMSFAKHRFDSMADPVGKAALMLLPICTLLSTISCDCRVGKDKRERAASALQLFTPKFCLSLGALADFNLISQAFIRKFDCLHHDIAVSERELLQFEHKMRKVFVNGWFLASHEQTVAGARELKGKFITELVRRQTKTAAVFSAGPKQLLVWGPNTDAEVRDVADRCSYMTEVMLERLRAESGCDQLRSSFQAFDLARIVEGRLNRPQDADERSNDTRKACLRGIKRLAQALAMEGIGLEGDRLCVVLEYVDVAPSICKEAGLTATPDNRELWCKVLDNVWLQKHFAHRIVPVVHLQAIVRLYLSVLDGECQVERDLGSIMSEANEHCNLNIDGVDDLVIVKSSKLKESADFGNVARNEITEFTKSCLRLWRATYGCRFGSYDKAPRKQTRQRKQNTYVSLKRDVLEAAHSRTLLSRRSRPLSAFVQGEARLGERCADLGASEFCTGQHNRFLEKTKAKKRETKLALAERELGRDPFPSSVTKAACRSFPSMDNVKKVAMLGPPQLEAIPGARPMSMETGPHCCCNAQIVVTDTLAPLLTPQSDSHHMSVADAIYIVGLGRLVTSTTSWHRARNDPRRLTQFQVTDHEPMALKLGVEITFSAALREARPEVYKALKHCCKVDKSKWRMRQAMTADVGREWLGDEQDVWKLLRKVRRVINYQGPKIARCTSGLNVIEACQQRSV